jgi:hypothetical protein
MAQLFVFLRSWATLPAPIRRAILAMIESVEKEE